MNITLPDYTRLKLKVKTEIEDTKDEIKDLFDGQMFNSDIYSHFTLEQRRLYSALRQILENLNGQLTAFERLEGAEHTKIDMLIKWKSELTETTK